MGCGYYLRNIIKCTYIYLCKSDLEWISSIVFGNRHINLNLSPISSGLISKTKLLVMSSEILGFFSKSMLAWISMPVSRKNCLCEIGPCSLSLPVRFYVWNPAGGYLEWISPIVFGNRHINLNLSPISSGLISKSKLLVMSSAILGFFSKSMLARISIPVSRKNCLCEIGPCVVTSGPVFRLR